MSCDSNTSSSLPGSWTPYFYQGATFNIIIVIESEGNLLDLTGYTAAMTLRDASEEVILSLTSTDGSMTLGGTAGTITFNVLPAVTAALPEGTYPYDLLLTSATNVTFPLVAGNAVVIESPTGEQ